MNLDQKHPLERRERKALACWLTRREREIAEMIWLGKSNKQIAMALNLSQKTVEAHRKNVMVKMKADSFAELVRLLA